MNKQKNTQQVAPLARRSTLMQDRIRAENDDSQCNELENSQGKKTNGSNARRVEDLNSSFNNSRIEIKGVLPNSPRKYNNGTVKQQ